MTTHHLSTTPPSRARAGFTLAEVLLASVLGAMLLTALSLSTMGFTTVLTDLETKAGVSKELDPVLRTVTRDVREAQWAEVVDSTRIRLADHQGRITEYFWNQADESLRVRRPNGDEGVIFSDAKTVSFTPQTVDRRREAGEQAWDGTWYSASTPTSGSIPFPIPAGAQLALAFCAPVRDADAGVGTGDERFISVSADVLRLPVAWIAGSGAHNMTVTIYESWAPGAARPLGTPLGTHTVSGSSLPPAVWDDGQWEKPEMLSIGLSTLGLQLEPGVCYTAVLAAGGNSQLLIKAYPFLPTVDTDHVAIQALPGTPWVLQPLVVPRQLSGSAQMTSTDTIEAVELITISVTPNGRPGQARSAALLSQAVSDDPWLGIVAGETLSDG